MKEGIIVYDSLTGNTEKIANVIANISKFDIVKVDSSQLNLRCYKILILGTPNIRANPSEKIIDFVDRVIPPKFCAIFITYGMPIWGQISSMICLAKLVKRFESKNSKCLAKFMCPGFHIKYKTYKGRPSKKDFLKAEKFILSILNQLRQKIR